MFWTSKDKPSASDTVTQSCSLWQRWVSERNIGCSSQCGVTCSSPGFSDLDSLGLGFLPDFCTGDPGPGLSHAGLLQPPGHQLRLRRKSQWRVRPGGPHTRIVCWSSTPGFTQTRRLSVKCTTCVWPSPLGHSRNSPSSVPMVSPLSSTNLVLLFTSFISGTIFNQEKLVCDAWFNVDCSEDTIANDATALELLDAERTFISLGLESDEPEKDYPWRFRSTA